MVSWAFYERCVKELREETSRIRDIVIRHCQKNDELLKAAGIVTTYSDDCRYVCLSFSEKDSSMGTTKSQAKLEIGCTADTMTGYYYEGKGTCDYIREYSDSGWICTPRENYNPEGIHYTKGLIVVAAADIRDDVPFLKRKLGTEVARYLAENLPPDMAKKIAAEILGATVPVRTRTAR